MRVSRALLAAVVPVAVVLAAVLNARAVSALIDGTLSDGMLVVEAQARSSKLTTSLVVTRSADAILDRNPFDHVTGALRAKAPAGEPELEADPNTAPHCEGVRAHVVVGDDDQNVAFASLEFGGQRILRRRGGDVGGRRVAYVGRDRVWLEGTMGLCQALVFAPSPPPEGNRLRADPLAAPRSTFEIELAKHIVKTGPNEFQIDRPMVDRILEAQQELMKARIVPEKEGDRIVGMKVYGIRSGSVLALIGIENGDRLETINGFELASPQGMLEAYGRLRMADRLTVHLTRGGKAQNLDYTIR